MRYGTLYSPALPHPIVHDAGSEGPEPCLHARRVRERAARTREGERSSAARRTFGERAVAADRRALVGEDRAANDELTCDRARSWAG
jgi:hypothetical protein